MKGKFSAIVFILMFASVIVLAAEQKVSEFGAIKGTIEDTTVNVFEKEINFPEPIAFLTRLIFGLKRGESVSLERFLLLVGIWVLIFAMVHAVIGFIPMFNDKKINIGISIVVLILIAMTGVISNLAANYFEFLAALKWLESLGPLKIFIGLIILIGIIYAIVKIMAAFNEGLLKQKAETLGNRAHEFFEKIKISNNSTD